ncbi:endonuclease/exonuclease/phosphatase family protein [uncultured Proteiniphilum sp.]|uniref:endonuclease/exonuclease/phosphatase family protein n=1 Tax=uncultured Proteiniphilum sp. TaxID=497637 RepID=UPI002623E007|nr:endonuclease/exonuclease/phosphatase family protein [uncultured Proteiniphilum sp.]
MKKILLSIFCLVLFHAGAQTFPQRENTHRLMSYNIHHGEGMDGKIDIERIGKLIIEINPEVVGLQEIDSVAVRSGNIDIMQLLSEQTGMHPTFGYSILHDGGKYGNGILTREKPVAVKKIALPGAQEARTALIVELDKYVVVNTHLSLTNEERLQSVKIITEAVKAYDKPVFLMGDLNAKPNSAPIKFLKNEWQILSDTNKYTSPSVNPRATIDYIMGYTGKGKTYERHRAEVIDERVASDHRPLFADIRLKPLSTPASKVMRTIPYLQNPGTDEMTVMWLTNVPARSWVEYGTDPANMKRARAFIEGVMVANNKINRIRLTGLQPGTRYYYRVVSQEITRYSSYRKTFGDTVRSAIKSFTTWSDDMRDFRVIVYNDIHSNMAMFNKLHSLVEDKPYDLVIFNGDCFDDVEKESDILDRLLTYTPRIKSDEIPSIFIRGNHETRGEYSLHLWDYLGRMGGRSYSAFSMGDTRFVLLDCGEDKPDDHPVYYDMNDFTQHRVDQAEFLKEELQSKEFMEANKRILIHHIPVFGVEPGSFSPCSDLWIPVLENAPFNISLNAHTHRYRVIEKGEAGNNFPVIIGGGNREPNGTVMVLEKKRDRLTLEVINAAGKKLLEREI